MSEKEKMIRKLLNIEESVELVEVYFGDCSSTCFVEKEAYANNIVDRKKYPLYSFFKNLHSEWEEENNIY